VISGVPQKYDLGYAYGDNDTVSYRYATSSVTIDLYNGWGGTSATQRDTYIQIDNATGSNFDDVIFGDNTSNTLRGGNGNDTIWGGRGNDTMDGGLGYDWISFENDDAHQLSFDIALYGGVVVSLGDPLGEGYAYLRNDIPAEWDTLLSFENARGSRWADILNGNNYDNIIEGMAGDDRIDGAQGNDRLTGGLDEDTFVFDIRAGLNPGFDIITDFAGDRLEFDVSNPALGMRELTIRQVGGNTVITYDDVGGSLTLQGVNASTLTLTDFSFV
jgi:Ca2+-binding RTX toxin-like protein